MKKKQIEIALIMLLVFLMLFQYSFINTFSKSCLGKLIMVLLILYVTENFGNNSGIILAFIMILNLYNAELEGFNNKKSSEKASSEEASSEEASEEKSPDQKSYVEGGGKEDIPPPEQWMSKTTLKKFKKMVKKLRRKREEQASKESFSILGMDRNLKKLAEYNKIALASQGNVFSEGKFGYVKRPF